MLEKLCLIKHNSLRKLSYFFINLYGNFHLVEKFITKLVPLFHRWLTRCSLRTLWSSFPFFFFYKPSSLQQRSSKKQSIKKITSRILVLLVRKKNRLTIYHHYMPLKVALVILHVAYTRQSRKKDVFEWNSIWKDSKSSVRKLITLREVYYLRVNTIYYFGRW